MKLGQRKWTVVRRKEMSLSDPLSCFELSLVLKLSPWAEAPHLIAPSGALCLSVDVSTPPPSLSKEGTHKLTFTHCPTVVCLFVFIFSIFLIEHFFTTSTIHVLHLHFLSINVSWHKFEWQLGTEVEKQILNFDFPHSSSSPVTPILSVYRSCSLGSAG